MEEEEEEASSNATVMGNFWDPFLEDLSKRGWVFL